MSNIYNEIADALQNGKHKLIVELTQKAIADGASPKDVLEKAMFKGMDIVGEKFAKNEIYVPEVLIAARAMNAGVAILKPLLAAAGSKSVGKACIGTVKGDLHDIGKNLVAMMLEGKGFQVIDLGVDVPHDKFYQTAVDEKCDIVAVSTLLTTTMTALPDLIKLFVEKGYRDKVKIMIGGAPISEKFVQSIGADGYAPDAGSAANLALSYMK